MLMIYLGGRSGSFCPTNCKFQLLTLLQTFRILAAYSNEYVNKISFLLKDKEQYL